MRIDVHVHIESGCRPETIHALRELAELIDRLGEKLMIDLTPLTDEVRATTGVEASAVTLIEGMITVLENVVAGSGADPATITQAIGAFKTSRDALAAAVAAGNAAVAGINTPPVTTTPAPETTPPPVNPPV